jgi:Flp pilus assembly pilin Flp
MLLTKIRARWNRLLKDRSGQSTTEYILILAIVVMIASKLKTTLTTKVVGAVDTLDFGKVMNQDP